MQNVEIVFETVHEPQPVLCAVDPGALATLFVIAREEKLPVITW